MKKILGTLLGFVLLCGMMLFTASCEKDSVDTPDLSGTEISSKSMTLDGDTLSISLPNATETFSFYEDITVAKNASFIVGTDISCSKPVASKTVNLSIGDNVFYVLVNNSDEMKLYNVLIRRKPVYTITFDTIGGTIIDTQMIEEGAHINNPTIPIKQGYTFVGWDYDFTQPISMDVTLEAIWEANGDTSYKVEYYYENQSKTRYELVDTVELLGLTDTEANIVPEKKEHFTVNKTKSKLNGNITGDGTLVLKVYYTRKTYTVSVSGANVSILGAGIYSYGEKVTLSTTTNIGCEFEGWYAGDNLVSTDMTYTCDISSNINAKFTVVKEMSNFEFISTDTACTITGIKDKNISEIIVPDYVTNIQLGAFIGCIRLKSITLPFVGESKKNITDDYQYPFGYIFGTEYYNGSAWTMQCYYVSSTVTPKTEHYYIPQSLKNVTLTNGEIPYGAFYSCDSLEKVTVSDNATIIGEKAFAFCDNLKNVVLGKNIQSIGNEAFYNCVSLDNIVIPLYVTNIGFAAFRDCIALKRANFQNPSGWKIGEKTIQTSDLTNSSTAAQYLSTVYRFDYWHRSI